MSLTFTAANHAAPASVNPRIAGGIGTDNRYRCGSCREFPDGQASTYCIVAMDDREASHSACLYGHARVSAKMPEEATVTRIKPLAVLSPLTLRPTTRKPCPDCGKLLTRNGYCRSCAAKARGLGVDAG